MIKTLIASAALVLAGAGATMAADFSWSGIYAGATASQNEISATFMDFSSSDDVDSYGAFVGVRHEFGNGLVGGAEANYNDIDGADVLSGEFQLGYAFDRILPYVSVGYTDVDGLDEGISFGAGVDYAFTDNLFAGVKYTKTEIDDYAGLPGLNMDLETVSVRVGFKF